MQDKGERGVTVILLTVTLLTRDGETANTRRSPFSSLSLSRGTLKFIESRSLSVSLSSALAAHHSSFFRARALHFCLNSLETGATRHGQVLAENHAEVPARLSTRTSRTV